jgi:hypothetical protein
MTAAAARRRVFLVAGAVVAACLCAAAALRDHSPSSDSEATVITTRSTVSPVTVRSRVQEGTEETAVAAAIDAAAAPQRWLYLTDVEVRAEVLEIATPSAGPALAELTVADVAAARADLALSPGPVWWLVHPLAAHLVSSVAGSAEVEIWTATVLSAVEIAAPQVEFLTVTVDLVWDDGRWLIDAIRDRPGPTPAIGPGDDPWDAAPFAEALDGFARLDGSDAEAASS